MAGQDIRALLQGIRPVPSVPSKSIPNFTSANQNLTESGTNQEFGKYLVIF